MDIEINGKRPECTLNKVMGMVCERERYYYNAKKVDNVLAEKDAEIRRLKRALWLAHAYKAKFKRWWLHLALDCEASAIRPDTKTINRIKGKIGNCEKSERKCRSKAEEYK